MSRNRFVRFRYRRPPPWNLRPDPRPASNPSSPPPAASCPPSWPTLTPFPSLSALHPNTATSPLPTSVPCVSHGISSILSQPGVCPLVAPWQSASRHHRSPYYHSSLRDIHPPSAIHWPSIPPYTPPCADATLSSLASSHGLCYVSSTSSVSPALSALYHLLSNFRAVTLAGLSPPMQPLAPNFSRFHRRPVAFMLSATEPYSLTNHSGVDTSPSILRDLGHSMERMLTKPPAQFVTDHLTPGTDNSEETQFFNYSQIGRFLLRAQIDARNDATGDFFDVKTRAVAPIRYDLPNYEMHTSARIRALTGPHASFEREFYDMIRTVFLKYSIQLRIGRMHGALVAYHNTSQILGLEYITLDEIDAYTFGNPYWANLAFGYTTAMLQKLLDQLVEQVGQRMQGAKGVKVVLATEWSQLRMYIFAQRIDEQAGDPLCAHRFLHGMASANNPRFNNHTDNNNSNTPWHFDSTAQTNVPGVSMIGASGQMRSLSSNGTALPLLLRRAGGRTPRERKRVVDERGIIDACATELDIDDLWVWQLDVCPFVNGVPVQKECLSVDQGDEFMLRYNLQQVPREDVAGMVPRFVNALARLYVK